MKKILMILFILAIASTVQADWMGYYTTDDKIRVPITSIDTLGRDLVLDSVHLSVHYQGEATINSASYMVGYATAGAGSVVIDSFINRGAVYYYFVDNITDIDNNEGDGNYSADLTLWVQGEKFHEFFAFGIGNAPANVVQISERVIGLAQFDSAAVAAYYGFVIHLNDAASNTNSTVGVDGTMSNPVSSLAAARILADSIGIAKYCIENNSSFTLDATYEDWHFIGQGESNEINFGGQDIDNSHFEHLMIAGIQGGTGLIWLDECYLDAADSLECVARNSWFSDTISVRTADNIVFDNCYSAVAGNNTPGLDFNSSAGTINVNVRHYSGGLALFNMTSNHTISYETDGQLVIDASCTSANITARGNMTITDNGTTTALTDAGVVNNNRLKNIISVVESQRLGHTHQTTGNIFYVDPTNGDTHANGNRGGIDDPYAGVQDCHDNAVTDSNHDLIILLAGAASSTDTLIEAVTLSKRYLFIRGPGRDFIWTRSGNGHTITITADGIELSGFQLETAATGTGNGIDLTDADFLKVHSVWINATQGDGINILRGDNAQICCNHFNGTGVSGAGQGIDIVGTAGTSNGNVIEDNIFRDPAGDAIQISGGTTINTTIKNNVIEGSTAWGIDIGASSVDAFVTDNRFGNNASGSINDGGTTTILINNEQWGISTDTTDVNIVQVAGDAIVDNNDGLLEVNVEKWKDQVPLDPAVTGEIRTSVAKMEANVLTANATAIDAFGAEEMAADAWIEMKNYVWANMDTALFPTDSSDFMQYLIDRFSGSVSLPDSLLEMIAVADSIFASIGFQSLTDSPPARYGTIHDKIGDWLGTGTDDLKSIIGSYAGRTIMATLDSTLDRIGPFGDSSISSTPFTIQYFLTNLIQSKIDSIFASLGFDTTDLHTKVDNLSLTGGGTEPETLIVLSTDDSTQIQGARVVVRTIDQSTVKVDGLTTDVNGKLILDLDADSFFVAVTANNYTQTLDTIVVAFGGQTDTLFMVLFDPGAPAGDLTRVYGRVQTGDVGIKGVDITAEIPDEYWPIRFGTALIIARRDTTTDSSGDWAIDLEANTDLTTVNEFFSDSTSYWIIEGTYQGEELFRYKVRVADDSTSQLAVPNVD